MKLASPIKTSMNEARQSPAVASICPRKAGKGVLVLEEEDRCPALLGVTTDSLSFCSE